MREKEKSFFKTEEGDEKTYTQKNDQYDKVSKKAKIIVRNLPFKNFNEESLHNLFSEYGDIEEVKLLKKEDGKLVGCGFVQFKKTTSAQKAIHWGNQREVSGRKIIIDWALPKDTYLKKIQEYNAQNFSETIKKETFDDDDDANIKNETVEYYIDKQPSSFCENESTDDENNLNTSKKEIDSESEKDLFSENDEENINVAKDIKKNNKIKFDKVKPMKPITPRPSDAEDGKTVFIRNVPFSATNEDLKECMKNYGDMHYALICIDKLTEHSKGTAFIKFKDTDSAKQCVKDSNKIYLQDAPLNVTYALTKENLENKKSKKEVVKDSRNLYLVREGVIVAGSKAASGVSASDMSKRLQLEQWKSQMLKNLNMFVSKTRLVIHNLPPSYDDSKLKQLFVKHGNPKAFIKEAKVMYEKNKVNAKGQKVSKEVGFVSYANHEDALLALRNINNNPKIFNPNKRPIVAFSIESKMALNQRQKRLEKSRAKLGFTTDDKLSKLNRKQRRFIKRREKFIERRKEAKKLKQSENGVAEEIGTDSTFKKRKIKLLDTEEPITRKKQKVNEEPNEEFKEFTGMTSEPGKKVKLRSKFNLKKQAAIHQQTLKKKKVEKKLKQKKFIEPIKQPKQKKGKTKLLDDSNLAKLISKHRQSIQDTADIKKWYET